LAVGSKIVLVGDHNSPTLISLGQHLAGDTTACRVYTARTADAVLQMARTYRPDYAIVVASMVSALGKALPDLIHEVSPNTQVFIAADNQASNPPT
jgi:hypothetical protein